MRAIDPLLSDGLNLTTALRRAGVPVVQRTYPGVTHEFFGMGSVVRGAMQANNWAVSAPAPGAEPARPLASIRVIELGSGLAQSVPAPF